MDTGNRGRLSFDFPVLLLWHSGCPFGGAASFGSFGQSNSDIFWTEEPAGDDYGVRLRVDFGNDDGNRHIKKLRADTGRTGFFPVPVNWQQRDCGKLYIGRDCTKYL